MWKSLLLVAFGGGLGSVLRFVMSIVLPKSNTIKFPYITFGINILGCLLIGILLAYYTKNAHWSKELLVAGFCGGFTTFSAFSSENLQLLQSGNIETALLYIAMSLVLGVGFSALGWYLMQYLMRQF